MHYIDSSVLTIEKVKRDFKNNYDIEEIFAFTPNGDGKNDLWTIPNLDLADGTQVHVFDRTGLLVFAASGSTVNWDGTFKGTPLQTGVFIFVIKYPDGFIQKGKLTLIR